MAQVIDLRGKQTDPAENIIRVIEAASKAQMSNINLKKELMLDEIRRERDLRDKASMTRQDEQIKSEAAQNWFAGLENNSAVQGVANSQTASQIGSAPMQRNWMTQQASFEPEGAAMSLPDGSVGDVYGNKIPAVQPQQTAETVAAKPQQTTTTYQGVQIAHPMDLYRQEGKPTAWLAAYTGAWKKLASGQELSQAEQSIVEDVNKIKTGTTRGSASLENAKNKRIENLLTTVGENQFRQQSLDLARQAVEKIDSGVFGKVKRDLFRITTPEHPLFEDWQNIKMVLTDAQLMYTAKTKGAISNEEMKLFQRAATNDDIFVLYENKAALDKLQRYIDSTNSTAINTYKRIYKEDPLEWEEMKNILGGQNPTRQYGQQQPEEIPTFASEEEAMAANPPIGSIIIINGQKVRVEE